MYASAKAIRTTSAMTMKRVDEDSDMGRTYRRASQSRVIWTQTTRA